MIKVIISNEKISQNFVALWIWENFCLWSKYVPEMDSNLNAHYFHCVLQSRSQSSFAYDSQEGRELTHAVPNPWALGSRMCLVNQRGGENYIKKRWPGYIRPIRCSSLTLYLGKTCPYGLFPPRLFGWIFSNYYLDNTDRKEIKDKELLTEQWCNEIVSIF